MRSFASRFAGTLTDPDEVIEKRAERIVSARTSRISEWRGENAERHTRVSTVETRSGGVSACVVLIYILDRGILPSGDVTSAGRDR